MSEEYPKIEPCKQGFEVYMNARVKLPGHYTSYLMAQRAINRYQGQSAQARKKK